MIISEMIRHKLGNLKKHQPVNMAKVLGFAAYMYMDYCISFEYEVHKVIL
jgi:hypothetical protein